MTNSNGNFQTTINNITLQKNIARITIPNVPDKPGIAYQLFSSFEDHQISIDMIVQNINHDGLIDISFTLLDEDFFKVQNILDLFIKSVGASPSVLKRHVAKLSIEGHRISSDVKIASTLFGKLYELGINIEMISSSETKIACIIEDSLAERVLLELKDYYHLKS